MKHHEKNEEHEEEPKYHITHLEREILMKLSELLTVNNSLTNQLSKIDIEIVAKLGDLQASVDKLTQQLADVELSDEQSQSVTAVQEAVNALDAIIPDSI